MFFLLLEELESFHLNFCTQYPHYPPHACVIVHILYIYVCVYVYCIYTQECKELPNKVLLLERIVLSTLSFDLQITLPYQSLAAKVRALKSEFIITPPPPIHTYKRCHIYTYILHTYEHMSI